MSSVLLLQHHVTYLANIVRIFCLSQQNIRTGYLPCVNYHVTKAPRHSYDQEKSGAVRACNRIDHHWQFVPTDSRAIDEVRKRTRNLTAGGHQRRHCRSECLRRRHRLSQILADMLGDQSV